MARIGDFAPDDLIGWMGLSPTIGGALGGYADAVYRHGGLAPRVREIARMVIALDNECEVCRNTRTTDGEAAGLDESFYDHVDDWRTWDGYTDVERVAAEFAERFARDHVGLREDDDFWGRVHALLTDEEITDLTLSCALWLGQGRALRVLDVGQACRLTL
ncbi:carboxymuconolactone decarboxylase family protein [Williamsia serinedens]|uniref:Carboxymuconolactone decarboxylase family protein n=1 Tax=Williamsia serinedens TaxID=391736 RepID=A0ABT1H523_9NOCA|nr:carboxymuconolactone decarboxylase family protein [Williamsia serinedens]MCP2162281.1 Carboxymuconolactone decarboxylase family protein [Williamsia serinedens]